VRQFKNHIELFSAFLDERRESQMQNLKKKTDKTPACLQKNFHG